MSSEDIEVKNFVASIGDLEPNESNPRKISRKDFEKLKESLLEFPEMKQLREIVVDENMCILAGHQRYYALQELDYKEVYVKQVIGLSEKKKREFIIKDNASSGEWDKNIILSEWDPEELHNWGVPKFKIDTGEDEEQKNEYQNHGVTCPNCGFHFDLNKD